MILSSKGESLEHAVDYKRTFLFPHVRGKANKEEYKRKYIKEFLIYFISFFSTNENELQTA